MTKLTPDATAPIVQLCVDVITMDAAIEAAELGLRAGVDWLELGTPMVSWVGINNFGPFVAAFPDVPKFLDGKVMDASGPYVHFAGELGIALVCLCASASDATFRTAIATGQGNGVKIVGDLYAVADPLARGAQLAELGVDYIYLHYGYDEKTAEPDGDRTLEHLVALKAITDVPIGIVTSTTEMGEEAARAGADVVLVSHPFLIGPDAEALLTDYVQRVKQAGRSRVA